jgi:hypothetical protein
MLTQNFGCYCTGIQFSKAPFNNAYSIVPFHICDPPHALLSVFPSYFFHKIVLVCSFTIDRSVFTVFALIAFVTALVRHIKSVLSGKNLFANYLSLSSSHPLSQTQFSPGCLLPFHIFFSKRLDYRTSMF